MMARRAAALAVCVGVLWSGAAPAQQSGTRVSGFAYDTTSGLMSQEVIEPDLSAFRLQTDYGRNAFGDKISITVSGADIVTRSASIAYDARGQFPTSATNALGQSESTTYDARFGLPSSHTDANGLVTSWQYDSLGRKVLEVHPDGTRSAWSYDYCSGQAGGTLSCPALATHRIEAKQLAADGVTPIAPLEQSYFDELGRVVSLATQGFDGTLIRATTEYDGLGRVSRQSRPYFDGTTPRWQQASYDVLNRPVLQTFADGATHAHAYHGLSITETNALGQTDITVSNSQGQVVSVTDAASSSNSYRYDPFGNLIQVTDAQGNVTTYLYDRSGRRISATDPDMGSWAYAYNVLGQLSSQTDAKSQTTTLSYDLLGRMTAQAAPDLLSIWTYDAAPNGIGRLATASTNGGYSRSHSYDALGRPAQVSFTIDGQTQSIATTYDAASRVSTVAYPSGFTAAYSYNAQGYQSQLRNAATSEVYWTANARDAEMHLTTQTFGNGIITDQSFDANTGRILSIKAGTGGALQNFAYAYDLLGNLLNRSDPNHGVSESFTYDSLNRLTTATVGVDLAKTFTYNTIGNILTKADVGTYSYPAPGQPRPHAVSSIAGSVINTTFSYDANGNQNTGNGLSLTYASINKPITITRGAALITFTHDPERQRYRQTGPSGETLYFAASGVSVEKFTGSGGVTQWTNYLYAAGEVIGMRVERSDGGLFTRYFHKDHLGSTAALSNEAGVIVESLAYDAWGKRRFPTGQDDPAGSLTSQTTRGFTGQEQLAEVGLIHMNGRVYDPVVGRFGSPDPFTADPLSTQGWNRYSYVDNNPLKFTDPTGYMGAHGGDGNSTSTSTETHSGNTPSNTPDTTPTTSTEPSSSTTSPNAATQSPPTQTRAPANTVSANITATAPAKANHPVAQAPIQLASAAMAAATPYENPRSFGTGGGPAGSGAGTGSFTQGTGGAPNTQGATSSIPGLADGFIRGTLNVVPGAHYSDLAQQEWNAGNYLRGTVYGVVSLGDAFVGVVTLGTSSLEREAIEAGHLAIMEQRLVRLGYDQANTARIVQSVENGDKVVIIGENMKRVDAVARMITRAGGKAVTYAPRSGNRNTLEANRSWLSYWAKDKGAATIDIGRQSTPRELGPSPFYGIENRSLNNWGIYTPFN